MTEGSVYDRELAALAIKQARGDVLEAIFLLRAFRATLPRFGATRAGRHGRDADWRRISATFKDLPGGQILGPTFDYTHRLLEPLPDEPQAPAVGDVSPAAMPRVTDLLQAEGLIEPAPQRDPEAPVGDLTREPLSFPADRDLRLQISPAATKDSLLALGYSTQRGYGRTHPFAGEIRLGEVEIEFNVEEVGFAFTLGTITVTECQMVTQFKGSAATPPCFTRGYGLVFGHCERKAMAWRWSIARCAPCELDEDSQPRRRTRNS